MNAAQHITKHIVIVGADAPAWLSACVLHYALAPAGVQVSVVELPGRARPADVYATLPALEPLHTRLRIDEAKLIGATQGAFTLGKLFADSAAKAPPFFHPYGSTGAKIDKKEFLPHWLKARRAGFPVAFDEFCLTAAAARHGRMLVPDSEVEGFGFTDYGYHLPAIPYGAWLRQLALRRGVHGVPARSIAVQLHESGDIASVQADGRTVAGDFFIDAGADALLLGALSTARESWRADFPADRLLTAFAAPLPAAPVYSEVRACPEGWVALQASQACTHVSLAYSSAQVSEAAALDTLTRMTRMQLHDAGVRVLDPGRRISAWERNCVAIGAAACQFDPIHSVDLQAVQVGLVHLLPLFPVAAEYAVERVEYNLNVRAAFERIRDFQQAHYLLNRYGDSPFWQAARVSAPGAELAHKIAAFRARGDIAYYEDETFAIDDWQALLLGHGVMPESYDPAVDRTPPELVQQEFRRILEFIRRKVGEQMSHADYLQTVCAPAPGGARASGRG
jgi:tryptophan halogenase